MLVAIESLLDKGDALQDSTSLSESSGQRLNKLDVCFPLTASRKRHPPIPILSHAATEDGQSSNVPRIRKIPSQGLVATESLGSMSMRSPTGPSIEPAGEVLSIIDPCLARALNFQDLPEEIQKRILDYIFGDMQPVNFASSSTGLSHRMRHPRRKAVSELALISPGMRFMVQERIYRHIKIKGTKSGLRESQAWFLNYPHLAHHVRHIEYWVPVWGDKASQAAALTQMYNQNALLGFGNELGDFAHDFPGGLQFKLSTYSATLDQIFDHLGSLFPNTSIFTLEGGHCKNSNMIKHFKANLFGQYMHQNLRTLPNIKVFAIRGAWNVMRSFDDWNTIQEALPCLTEWHCGYAKPRVEAYSTINEILLQLPLGLRHVDISLDSMFSKDDSILGSSPDKKSQHICEQLGRIAPHLESLTYTGKVCECFWSAALEAVEHDRSKVPILKTLNVVVKNCCRQRVKSTDTVTGDVFVEEIGGIMADGAGIGNLVFINAFERLVMGALGGLASISSLEQIKIRYIDLDSPCQQLNPYWHLEDGLVTGVWNDRIVEKLTEVRPQIHYERLEDGLGGENSIANPKKDTDDIWDVSWTRPNAGLGAVTNPSSVNALYPRMIPKSINTGSYKILSEARIG